MTLANKYNIRIVEHIGMTMSINSHKLHASRVLGVILLELAVSLLPHFTGLLGSVFPTHLAAPGQVWWRGAGW